MDELIISKTSSMSITTSEEKQAKSGKTRKTSKKNDVCQELKNIAYRTMLLNGNDINPTRGGKSASSITSFLEEELSSNKISIADIERNKYQPRTIFDDEKLNELSESIKINGIIQPIAVRVNKFEKGKYEMCDLISNIDLVYSGIFKDRVVK